MNLEVIRTLKVQASVTGVDQVTGQLGKLAAAQGEVASSAATMATVTETSSRRQLSAAASYDRLRASIDPVYRAQQQITRGEQILQRSLEQGIIEANQYSASLAMLASKHTLAGAASASALKLNAGQVTNLGYQINDIATGLLTGQSPFMIMAQQGSQLTQVFGAETGLRGALKGIKGALVSYVTNPLNVAFLGFGLAATAAEKLFGSIDTGADRAKKDLETHRALVEQITRSYDGAAQAAKHWGEETAGALRYANESEIARLKQNLANQSASLAGELGGQTGVLGSPAWANPRFAAFAQPIKDFVEAARAGRPDVDALNNAIRATVEADPSNGALRKTADYLLALDKVVGDTARALREANALKPLIGIDVGKGGALPRSTYQLGKDIDLEGAFPVDHAAEAYAKALREVGQLDLRKPIDLGADAMAKFTERMDAFRDITRDTMSTFLGDLRQGTSFANSLSDAIGRLGDKLADKTLNQGIDALFGKSGTAGGGLLSGLFGGFGAPGASAAAGSVSSAGWMSGLYHTGGIVGAFDAAASRIVHPSYFDDAPRFHGGGIMPGEVPIIAQPGEGIFTPGQMRALGMMAGAGDTRQEGGNRQEGGGITVSISVDARGSTMTEAQFTAIIDRKMKPVIENLPSIVARAQRNRLPT